MLGEVTPDGIYRPAEKRLSLDDRLAVTPAEAAQLLGNLHVATVYRLMHKGVIRARHVGRRWLIPVDALRQILTDASDLPSATPKP